MNDRELMEPIEVVGYLNTATDEVVKYGPTLMDWDDEQEPVEPLMTVAQHKRLMANHSADDLNMVKVPRELANRLVSTDNHVRQTARRELRNALLGGEA